MHFDCSHCQQRLAIEDNRVGESLVCPACALTIAVPPVPRVIYKGRRPRKSQRAGALASGTPRAAAHRRPHVKQSRDSAPSAGADVRKMVSLAGT